MQVLPTLESPSTSTLYVATKSKAILRNSASGFYVTDEILLFLSSFLFVVAVVGGVSRVEQKSRCWWWYWYGGLAVGVDTIICCLCICLLLLLFCSRSCSKLRGGTADAALLVAMCRQRNDNFHSFRRIILASEQQWQQEHQYKCKEKHKVWVENFSCVCLFIWFLFIYLLIYILYSFHLWWIK